MSTFRLVDVLVCRRFGLSTFRLVDVLVCRRFGLSTFWFVDVSVCRRFGLSTFRLVDVSVCRRFGLSTFRLSTFRCVDVLTSNRLIHTWICSIFMYYLLLKGLSWISPTLCFIMFVIWHIHVKLFCCILLYFDVDASRIYTHFWSNHTTDSQPVNWIKYEECEQMYHRRPQDTCNIPYSKDCRIDID